LSPEDNDPSQLGWLATSLRRGGLAKFCITNAPQRSWTTKLIANQQVPQHIPTTEA
jgi:hypothetical protein